MSNYPMVDEVNRLVGNILAAGGGVFLPGVGALFVERRGARRLSKRTVQPPCRVVSFSSQQQGVSLVDELSRAVRCDAAGAQDIYDRWLAHVQKDGMLTIEGVGVLKFKHFTLSPAFDRLLNPQGHEPVRIRPAHKFDWALWIGIAAIVVAAGFGGAEFLKSYPADGREAEVAAAEIPQTVPAAGTGIPADTLAAGGQAGAGTGPDGTNVIPETAAVGTTAGAANAPARQADGASQPGSGTAGPAVLHREPASEAIPVPTPLVSGRRYVVLGVFSTPENAARAAAAAEAKEASVHCGVYRFGDKFMVSPFEAPDAEACTLFIRNYSDRFPGLWTYTAR